MDKDLKSAEIRATTMFVIWDVLPALLAIVLLFLIIYLEGGGPHHVSPRSAVDAPGIIIIFGTLVISKSRDGFSSNQVGRSFVGLASTIFGMLGVMAGVAIQAGELESLTRQKLSWSWTIGYAALALLACIMSTVSAVREARE